MQKSIILPILLAFTIQSAIADEKVDRFTDEQLVRIIRGEGYSSVEIIRDGTILIKLNGIKYGLFNDDDGDLQLMYGNDLKLSYKDINEWNMTKRFSRAYLDSDSDPILESDLMSDGGINEKNVTRFLSIFFTSADEFREFTLSRDR